MISSLKELLNVVHSSHGVGISKRNRLKILNFLIRSLMVEIWLILVHEYIMWVFSNIRKMLYIHWNKKSTTHHPMITICYPIPIDLAEFIFINWKWSVYCLFYSHYINGLLQERCNSFTKLRLSFTNPSKLRPITVFCMQTLLLTTMAICMVYGQICLQLIPAIMTVPDITSLGKLIWCALWFLWNSSS